MNYQIDLTSRLFILVFALALSAIFSANIYDLGSEEVLHVSFENEAKSDLFTFIYGDAPEVIAANGAEKRIGHEDAVGHIQLGFNETAHIGRSYWGFNLKEPIPIDPRLGKISFKVRSNVPIGIKVEIAPFGFIYHGPEAIPSENWQTLEIDDAYEVLRKWCAIGGRDVAEGKIASIIINANSTFNSSADVYIDHIIISGKAGINNVLNSKKNERVLISVVTQLWSDRGRSLSTVLDRLDEAGMIGSDIVCLPMECVNTDGESIPGPISKAIAEKARGYRMYIIGNIREIDGNRTYITSFLCDRSGNIIGKYRKSHKMPDEDIDLGNDLPIFDTDLGKIALRIGSDRFFPEIDQVYASKGAKIIFWSQEPEPVEDEYSQDMPSAGRAADYNVFIACSRYSLDGDGWITNFLPLFAGCPIGRSYIINREGERIASTTRNGSVATAVIPAKELTYMGRAPNKNPAFSALTEPVRKLVPGNWSKRVIRVTAIENPQGIDDLLCKLDQAGQMGSDVVCTYEMTWITSIDPQVERNETASARENLRRISERAKRWKMYIIASGVIDSIERNEAIIYGRDGLEVGRYFKIFKTHDQQIVGNETPVFDTDFGRIGVRICADEWMAEIDRCYSIKGADIIFAPTQSWSPDALFRDLRDISRSMDNQVFLVEATHASSEVMHRSKIIEPTGITVARTEYLGNGIATAIMDLDKNRPLRYTRNHSDYTPEGNLSNSQAAQLPEGRNDLKETIIEQRRPELYSALA